MDQLIEEATIDTYDGSEQLAGFLAVLQDNLPFPFPGRIIDEPIMVTNVDVKNDKQILATIEREGREYLVDILDVDIDTSKIKGGEWLAAYQKWSKNV